MSSGSRCREAPRVGRRKGVTESAGSKAEEKPLLVLVLLLGPLYRLCARRLRAALEEMAVSCIKSDRRLLVYLNRVLVAQPYKEVRQVLAAKPEEALLNLPHVWELEKTCDMRRMESVTDCLQSVLDDLYSAGVHRAKVCVITDDMGESAIARPKDVLELAGRNAHELCMAGLVSDPENRQALSALAKSLRLKPGAFRIVAHNGQPNDAIQAAISWLSGGSA